MVFIEGFRGLVYNTRKVDISDVSAPPYDIISAQEQDALYRQSQFNIIRVILGKGDDRYAEARRSITDWCNEGVLAESRQPGLYVYQQEFTVDNVRYKRLGFMGLVRIGEGIYPHEETMSRPVQDRLLLMESTGTAFEPIFSFYSDPEKAIDSLLSENLNDQLYRFTDEKGIEHSLWQIGADITSRIALVMRSMNVFIADGHHRYETAKQYQARHPAEEGAGFVLMNLVNAHNPGMVILPIHRVVDYTESGLLDRLGEYFRIGQEGSISMHYSGKTYGLELTHTEAMQRLMPHASPTLRQLPATILHRLIIEKIMGMPRGEQEYRVQYLKYHAGVEDEARKMRGTAFFLPATDIKDVISVAGKGERMPQKSTFFYPKVRSGLVGYRFRRD
ncbi:MAG: DUF1015 domain-containing protein [archaeon]